MENASLSTDDRESGLLVKNSPRAGRDAATQTPQMVRHLSATRRQHVRPTSLESSSSDESSAFEDSMAFQPTSNGHAEVSCAMPIPDVIIETSKDTMPLTQERFDLQQQKKRKSGITNFAFQSQDQNSETYFQPKPGMFVSNSQLDPHSLSMVNFNGHQYYSLPKTAKKMNQHQDIKIHSQPQTPQMKRTTATAINGDSSNFWIIPQVSSSSLNTFPNPASKYPSAEDSVSGLYTISGRSTAVSNGYPEPVVGDYEIQYVQPLEKSGQSTPKNDKKFEFTPMPASVDKRRRRLQRCTDALALAVLIPGLLIAVLSPIALYPLFFVTQILYGQYIMIFVALGTLSALVIAFSGVVGNVVWIYDPDSKKLKSRLHCGRGPTFHFWGNSFYEALVVNKEKEKEFIV